MTYAVFGDSFVSRLDAYLNGDLGFQHPVHFFGEPGMGTRRKFAEKFDELCESQPRYVFIILGGNDISSTSTPGDIFFNLKGIVEELMTCGVERVFVASIPPRSRFHRDRFMSRMKFDAIRKGVNDKLRKKLPRAFVDLGKFLPPLPTLPGLLLSLIRMGNS